MSIEYFDPLLLIIAVVLIYAGRYPSVMLFPFLIEIEGKKALIEWEATGLFGPGKLHGFFLDNPNDDKTFDIEKVSPIDAPLDGIDGQKLRFVLADRWLDKQGNEGMSMALRASVDFSPYQLRPLFCALLG